MCDKKKFTKKEAVTALNHNKKQGFKFRHEKRYYYCSVCNSHHLTHLDIVSGKNHFEELNLKYKDQWKNLMEGNEE